MVDVFKIQIKIFSVLIALVILSTSSANAQLLWKISGNECKESYLFGTHHFIPSEKAQEIRGLDEAFNKCSLVVGEISMDELSDPIKAAYMSQAMLAPQDSLLNTVLTAKAIEQILQLNKEYPNPQVPLDAILNYLTPTGVTLMLTANITMNVMKKIFPEDSSPIGIDFIFQQKAKENNKTVKGLETIAFQTDLLYKSSSISKSADELNKNIDCITKHIAIQLKEVETLTLNYLNQNLQKMVEQAHSTDNPCTLMQMQAEDWDKMVNNRNQNWIPILKELMQRESTFIAVGALHLPGEKGIIELLQKEGYLVEPITL